jgi:murein biosynthesis integral membrane protein MurJ
LTPPVSDPGSPDRRRARSGHQQDDSEWNDDRLYEDTGWHPDLSDLGGRDDRGGYARYRDPADRGAPSFPPESAYERNGAYPADPRSLEPGADDGRSSGRPAGRHARRAGGEDPYGKPDRRAYYEPERQRDNPRYRERGYPEPQPGSPRGDYQSGPDSWTQPARRQPDYTGQPEHSAPTQHYPEPGRDYVQRAQPGMPRSDFGSGQGYPGPPQAYPEPRPRGDQRGYPPPQSRDDHPGYADRDAPGDHLGYQRRPARDGYWSMSDPADYADPRLGAEPVDDEDLPGQPAFMRYRDPAPLYVEPPGQPFTEQTRILPALWEAPPAAEPGPAAEPVTEAGPVTGSFSIARSSSVMAVGTLASRLTGFVRTLIQVYVLGTLTLSNVYNNANTLPNVVYNLALGGILTSVIVPLIVNARKRDADRGEAYNQRMFTLITGALLGITLVATLAAAPLVYLYRGNISGTNLHLMVIFAYFFIPQIFFYGMSSLIGAVLNSRGSFAAPMWTPVINNIVVIAVLLLYLLTAGPGTALSTSPHLSGSVVLLLGVGTTLGIVAQTVALIPALRRVGFRWRPRWDFQRSETSEIGRMGGWMFCYVAATQIAFLVTTVVCNDAQPNSGYTAYTYAWQLFQLPYAVVGISVITALLPRMSSHASEGRFRLVRSDFSSGVRLGSVIVVPCSLILAALGPDLALVFLDHGRAGGAGRADYIGVVFAVFCLGLMPYMLFQLQLRVFYSLHDSKTPALIGVGTMTLNIVANVIALNVLPARDVVAGLGVGFGLANLLGTFLAWRILSQRLRGLDGRTIAGTLAKMHAAAIPGALFAITIGIMVTDTLAGGRTGAAITIVVGGGGALLLYVLFAKALRVAELASVTSTARTVVARYTRWPF